MNTSLRYVIFSILIALATSNANATSYNISFLSPTDVLEKELIFNYGDNQQLSVKGLAAKQNQNISYVDLLLRGQGKGGNGQGMEVKTSGFHGFNNGNANDGLYEMALFDFGQNVTLDSFSLRWGYDKSNLSILALTGSDTLPSIESTRWNSLLTSGFENAGDPDDYKDVALSSSTPVNGSLVSRYWLIGAFNEVFEGTSIGEKCEEFRLGNLQFSVVNVDVSEVPLPAAAWLFLTGLAGLGFAKKRAKAIKTA